MSGSLYSTALPIDGGLGWVAAWRWLLVIVRSIPRDLLGPNDTPIRLEKQKMQPTFSCSGTEVLSRDSRGIPWSIPPRRRGKFDVLRSEWVLKTLVGK